MPDLDLDAAIRDAVAMRPNNFPGMSPGSATRARYAGWSDRTAAAIISVLDYHRPILSDVGDGLICGCLVDSDDHSVAHAYPCATVRRIAKALGVEVGRG